MGSCRDAPGFRTIFRAFLGGSSGAGVRGLRIKGKLCFERCSILVSEGLEGYLFKFVASCYDGKGPSTQDMGAGGFYATSPSENYRPPSP